MASSPRLLTKYVRNTLSSSRMNALVPCHSSTPKSASKSSVIVYHGHDQPIRSVNRVMSGCGAREAKASVVSRAFRCATWATWSATSEHPGHACSGQPYTPGSKNARYTISWRRPSNRSSRLAFPFGPSNTYSFSTACHGIRRRSAASASRARVTAFSFTSSCCRADSHSSGETIGGVFIVNSSSPYVRSCSCAVLQVVLQRVERAVPVACEPGQDLFRHSHRRRAKLVPHPPALPLLCCHQASLGQQRQVLGDRLPGNGQAIGQVSCGRGTSRRQGSQDCAPARIRESTETLLGNRLDVRPHRGSRRARRAP